MKETLSTSANTVEHIFAFFDEIGIRYAAKDLPHESFLPGLDIQSGVICYDPQRLKYLGDLLHEAGHLACTDPVDRAIAGSPELTNWPDDGNEIAAILWSYSAALYLEIPLDYVFHPDGYKGSSDWLIEQFESGTYIGLPLLEWLGLCIAPEEGKDNALAFPHMIKWLR